MKVAIFILLFVLYIFYSFAVYTIGTNNSVQYSNSHKEEIKKGMQLFQNYNCIACHQLYGLGGYLGPELTTVWSDVHRGEKYAKSFLKYGGLRMPKFNLNEKEIKSIMAFLQYVDSTAVTYKLSTNE